MPAIRFLRLLSEGYAEDGRESDGLVATKRLLAASEARATRPNAPIPRKHEHARDLLTCKPRQLQDLEMGLRLALEVNEQTGFKDPEHLGTLALAYSMNRDLVAARKYQSKALGLLPEDSPDRPAFVAPPAPSRARFATGSRG